MVFKEVFKWSENKQDLLIIISLSLALKLLISMFTEAINNDGVVYITAAQEFARGHFKEGFSISRMPFYPLLIVLFHSIVPNWVAAARLVSLLTSVLTIIPLYLLTKALFDQKAAFWACVAFAISPLPNHLSVEVIRDPAYVFFFAWTIYFAYAAVKSQKYWLFLMAGIFSAFAFLCRLEGLILFPCLIVFFLYNAIKDEAKRKILLKGILIYFAVPIIFLSLFVLYLQSNDRFFFARLKHFNRFSYIKHHTQDLLDHDFLKSYKLIYAKLEDLGKTLPRTGGGLHFAEIARQHMYAVYLIGLLQAFINAIFLPFVIPLGFGLKKSRLRNHAFILLLLGVYLLLLYSSLMKRDVLRVRHLLAAAFLLYPWIGVGLYRIVNTSKKSVWQRSVAILFILGLGAVSTYKSVDVTWKQDDVVVRAGKWIKARGLRKTPMITTDRRVAFYAGKGKDYLRYDGSEYFAMEKLALEKGYDVLVIRTSKKRMKTGPQLTRFTNKKQFIGVKDIVAIYFSPKLQENLAREGSD
jgi:4-amino-4-deoxy-L-arabinose transferase-like glycosyltransferase